MPALTIEGLDESTLESLTVMASEQGATVEEMARSILISLAGSRGKVTLVERLRALRSQDPEAPSLATSAIVRAERAARAARILGDDETAAWARGYREATGTPQSSSRRDGEAA